MDEIKAAREQLKARGDSREPSAARLDQELADLAGSTDPHPGDNTLGELNAALASLQPAVDSADTSPTAEENAAFMRLAQRLIQQQDAAINSPAAMRAAIPEQGRLLTFKRSVVVDTFADLKIAVRVAAARAASRGSRAMILAATFLILTLFFGAARSVRRPSERPAA